MSSGNRLLAKQHVHRMGNPIKDISKKWDNVKAPTVY
jgi:hypothetical protein